jgi:hypothetical protein
MKTRIVFIISQLELGGAQKVCLALFQHFSNENPAQCSLVVGSGGILDRQAKSLGSIEFVRGLAGQLSVRDFFFLF